MDQPHLRHAPDEDGVMVKKRVDSQMGRCVGPFSVWTDATFATTKTRKVHVHIRLKKRGWVIRNEKHRVHVSMWYKNDSIFSDMWRRACQTRVVVHFHLDGGFLDNAR